MYRVPSGPDVHVDLINQLLHSAICLLSGRPTNSSSSSLSLYDVYVWIYHHVRLNFPCRSAHEPVHHPVRDGLWLLVHGSLRPYSGCHRPHVCILGLSWSAGRRTGLGPARMHPARGRQHPPPCRPDRLCACSLSVGCGQRCHRICCHHHGQRSHGQLYGR